MQATLDATRDSVGDLVSATPDVSRRTDPDGDVIELVAHGQVRAALVELMQRYGDAVYRYCCEALHDVTLADDVHQLVFIGAFRDLPGFRGRSTVRTWLFAIARHRVLDAAKRRRRAHAHIEQVEAVDAPSLAPSPTELIDDTRVRQALVASLGELGDVARTAVLLRYQQGFSFEEMAEICREKPDTLRARVARALPLLRAGIERRVAR